MSANQNGGDSVGVSNGDPVHSMQDADDVVLFPDMPSLLQYIRDWAAKLPTHTDERCDGFNLRKMQEYICLAANHLLSWWFESLDAVMPMWNQVKEGVYIVNGILIARGLNEERFRLPRKSKQKQETPTPETQKQHPRGQMLLF